MSRSARPMTWLRAWWRAPFRAFASVHQRGKIFLRNWRRINAQPPKHDPLPGVALLMQCVQAWTARWCFRPTSTMIIIRLTMLVPMPNAKAGA